MALLIAGLLLFCGTHLFLSLAVTSVDAAKQRLGEVPVKLIITVFSIAGLALIVIGWRSAAPVWLYAPPTGLRAFSSLLVAIALYLFVVSNRPSVVKRGLRHPQLTGVIIWAVAHLLLNGDSRSLALFAGMGSWALLEIVLINRRDGAWSKPPAPPLTTDLVTAVVAALVIAAVAWAHPWIAGVPAIPGR